MASISLPRVLQPRKTSLEIERENFEKFQTQSISKAINAVETPVKEKHVRSTIIGTFHGKGAVTFWVVALRLPLQENRIVAWKFCHVLHKILREGHYNCLEHSQRHTGMIEDLGKLWVHLKEYYGKLIQLYSKLLITKINFHKRNHRFPGNLQLTGEELNAIGENDINNYFQMCVEIFDYMDDVLALQLAIFDSINNTSSSMTSAGQCRLAPILPCVQDSNQLYDFSVKLLFKLHAMLPPDTLSGHRDRFMKQFRILKKFYQKTDKMQYFKNLVSIPSLPENPPNFLIQSELRTYVPPVVILPPEEHIEEQDLVGNLIDTSDTFSQMTSPDTPSDHTDYAGSQSSHISDPIIERDSLIDHLQSELSRFKGEIHSMVAEHRSTMSTMNEHMSSLENQLVATRSDLEHEREQRRILEEQLKTPAVSPEFEERIQVAEVRAKGFEEKFQKLKLAYTQMREEHITLIRQKAETDKLFSSLKKSAQELEVKNEVLQTTNNRLTEANSKESQVNVKSANEAKAEVELIKQDLEVQSVKHNQEKEELLKNVAQLQQDLARLTTDKDLFQQQKEDLLQQKHSADDSISELHLKIKDVQAALSKEIKNSTIGKWSLMKTSLKSSSDIIKGTIHELDNPAISSLKCGLEYFKSLLPLTGDLLNQLEKSLIVYEKEKNPSEDVANEIVFVTHLIAASVIQGVATSNTSKDIVFGEQMAQECRELANTMSACIDYVKSVAEMTNDLPQENGLSNGASDKNAKMHVANVRRILQNVGSLADKVGGQDDSGSGDSVEGELINMEKSIEEATARIEEMLRKSRAADSGLKLEVNEKILDACTSLMASVRELVKKARSLQGEIIARGRGTNTAKEFYKRNHQWTEGLISAAKSVAMGAKLLLTAADKVVANNGKLEHLMVASQEVAASTAQLVVASRVRAERGSEKLNALAFASRAVSTATGAVIATAKTCAMMVEESEDLDMTGMSWQAGRRMEMESRVRVLELEQALATERLKHAALRRTNYRLGDTESQEADVKL